MPSNRKLPVLPSRMRYKLLVAFCLMSLLPVMVGVYVASLFVEFPFTVRPVDATNLPSLSLIFLCTMILSYLGYKITQQMIHPILDVTAAAEKIAQGNLADVHVDLKGADELEELSRSLKTISKNARDLLSKVEKLSLKDALTGLYNVSYMRERLNEEIQRAIHYQRPCSFAYLNLNHFEEYAERDGVEASEDLLKSVANVFNRHLGEFDRAARINKCEFAVIFPDKNKKKTIEIVEHMRKELEMVFLATNAAKPLGLAIGVSENPIDGMTADELYVKAQSRMNAAKVKGANHLEAFA